MPVMEHQPTRDARIRTIRESYDVLSQLLAKLSPPSPRSLSQDKLQALSIKTAAMALRPEGNHDAHPLFCKLVSPDMMDEAFDTTFTSENSIDWPGYEPLESSGFYPAYSIGRTLLHYTLSGQDIQEPLVDIEWYVKGDSSEALTLHRNVYPNTPDHPYGHYQSGICQILRVDNTSRPHLACLHIDDAPADEGLRPSELISAIKLMMQAMRLDRRAQFRVNPVFVYSFSSYRARILETCYEAGTFIVKKTPYLDFAEENKGNIKLYLRWMMSRPCGNTTFASGKDCEHVSSTTNDTNSSAINSSED